MKRLPLFLMTFLFALSTWGNHPRLAFPQWCDDLVGELEQAKYDAYHAYTYGNYVGAIGIFRDTLNRLNPYPSSFATSTYYSNQSLSLKALKRGQEILSILETKVTLGAKRERLISFFLSKYFDLIIDVANRLDRPYYRYQYHYNYDRHHNASIGHAEQAYVKMAFEQIKLVMNHFTIIRGYEVYPKGSSHFFLNLVALSSLYVAQDLENSFLEEYYACQIFRLKKIHQNIYRYLSKQGKSSVSSYVHHPRYMVQKAYTEIQSIIKEGRQRCSHPPHTYIPYHPPTSRQYATVAPRGEDILKEHFRLLYGDEKTVKLPLSRYIGKLLINAEGIYNDAIF